MRRLLPGIVIGFLMCLGLLLATTAVAADSDAAAVAVGAPAIHEFVDAVIKIAIGVISLLATWGATRAISFFEKKTKIDIPERQEAMVDHWIRQGIALAEEKAHQKAKDNLKLEPSAKRDMALAFAWDMAQRFELADWTKARIEDKLHAALGTSRRRARATAMPPAED